MRAAAARYGTAGSLVLTALVAAPAGSAGAAPPSPEIRGTAVAAQRAETAGIRWGACAKAEKLPASLKCGTVSVPLDYARPDGRQIRLTVSRAKATGKYGKRAVARQGALVFNPGGPGGSGMYFPLMGLMPEWKRLGAAYDLVGYAPRGVGRSAPLSCQDPKEYAKRPRSRRATPTPRTSVNASRRRRRTRAGAPNAIRGCGTTRR